MIIDLIVAGVISGTRELLPRPRGGLKKRDCFRRQKTTPAAGSRHHPKTGR
jgi:hypothetical protein